MVFLGLFLLLALSAVQGRQPDNDSRLIDFGPNTRPQWLPQSSVDRLIFAKRHNFIDITDHQDVVRQTTVAYEYPDQPRHKEEVNRLINHLSAASLERFNDMLSSFYTRYYKHADGVEAANSIFKRFAEMGGNNPSFGVEHFTHSRFPQPSVIARFQGTGKNASADEIVILGAHEDSVGTSGTSRSPGADDDGSGTSCVLEVFRVLADAGWQPSRTVEFHTYAAEEAGLLGSQDIANAYQKAGKKVYGMMQLDMTMFPGKSGVPQFGLVTDFVDPKLTAFVRLLVDSYSKLNWVDTKCGYGCSDHASWTRAGYQSVFPFESTFSNSNPYIHSASDTKEHISFEHGLEFAKVALAYLIELAE